MTTDLLARIHEIQEAIGHLQVSEAKRQDLRSHLDAIESELRAPHTDVSTVQGRMVAFEEIAHEVNEMESTAVEANAAKLKIYEWMSSVTYALGFR